jgi:hypothetical protein
MICTREIPNKKELRGLHLIFGGGARASVVERLYAIIRKVVGSRPDEMNESFAIGLILPAELSPGAYSTFNRNEYQKQKNIVSVE